MAGFGQSKNERSNWLVEVSFLKNINDPRSLMKDHDWFTGNTGVGYFDGKFSYTKSDVEMNRTLITLEARKRLFYSGKSSFYAFGGFRFEQIKQDIIGYDGWQIDIFNDPTFTPQSGYDDTVRALYYEVKYSSPFFGAAYDLLFSNSISMNITAAYMMVSVSDLDDHLLRFKIAEADGSGSGIISTFNMRWEMRSNTESARPYIEMTGEFISAKVSTNQTQRWYGDDPFQDGDETGTVISGIPHDIFTTQLSVGVSAGITF
jgi:hypothetical protein